MNGNSRGDKSVNTRNQSLTKHYDWFALVNKYFRGKIMRTSLTLTEVWPISDRIIRQKYYCITVHYRTVCTSQNRLGHLELFSDYVRGPTPNKIPDLRCHQLLFEISISLSKSLPSFNTSCPLFVAIGKQNSSSCFKRK